MLPHGYPTDLPYAHPWRDDWLAVVSESNSTVCDVLTTDDIASWMRDLFQEAGRLVEGAALALT